jgi:hypothetical protein
MSQQMIGSIGVDITDSRAAIGLLEWSGGQIRQGPVGDGRRILIPVAATESAWGSQAAEAVLAALPGSALLADSLRCWRWDPWSEEFLSGLRRRLLSYLGQPESAGFRAYQIRVCADLENPGSAAVTERLDAAGLTDAELVHPADALLCRWLAETPPQPEGPVLAVACGETATHIALYTVRSGADLAVRVNDQRRVAAGSDAWTTELAGEALRLCRPGVPAHALLSLLDGADEFAALLRTGPRARDVDMDATIEWAGPMSQFMFEPLRATRDELEERPSVKDWTAPVAIAVRGLLGHVAGRVTLLVGGPGAAWPFVADTLAGLGAVWESGDPTLDLALGACWWQPFRWDSARRSAPSGHKDPQSRPTGTVPWSTPDLGPVPGNIVPSASVPGAPRPGDAGAARCQDGGETPWDNAPARPSAIPSATPVSTATPSTATPVAATAAPPADDELRPWETHEHH